MQPEKTEIFIRKLQADCYVGVPIAERKKSQVVQIDVVCELTDPVVSKDDISLTIDYSVVVTQILSMLRTQTFVLLETLTEAIAEICFQNPLVGCVLVRVLKPKKLRACEAVGVERTFRR